MAVVIDEVTADVEREPAPGGETRPPPQRAPDALAELPEALERATRLRDERQARLCAD